MSRSTDKFRGTTVTVTKNPGGAIRSVETEGHSGYSERGGDIICASVSSLVQALWIGLGEIIGVGDMRTERDENIPRMAIEWNPEIQEAQLIARVIARSLEAVAEANPKYVRYCEIKE